MHGKDRCPVLISFSTRAFAPPGGEGGHARRQTKRSCPDVGRDPPHHLSLDESLPTPGAGSPQGQEEGPSHREKLLPWQAAQIAKAVMDHHPEQLKLPFFLWTREAVALLIRRRFGVRLSVWTVGRYLKRWGFTPQKPARRAWEQNPEQVWQWLEKE